MRKKSKLNLNITCLFLQGITQGHLVFDTCPCYLLSNYHRLDHENTSDDANVLVSSLEKLTIGLSKLYLNYSVNTNAGKCCLIDS